MQYRGALLKKYGDMPEVKRIHLARKVPGLIRKMTATGEVQKASRHRKQANRAKTDNKGTEQFVSERKKTVVKKID